MASRPKKSAPSKAKTASKAASKSVAKPAAKAAASKPTASRKAPQPDALSKLWRYTQKNPAVALVAVICIILGALLFSQSL